MSSPFSSRAVRLAMLDGMKQEDERTQRCLSERLRDEAAAAFRIQREIVRLGKELLVVQRRIAATADLIAIEEMGRAA